jgi:hypothetical protein
MHHLNTIHGGKAELSAFMLFSQLDEMEAQDASIDDVMLMLKASVPVKT